MVGSICRSGKSYYSHVFLEERKCIIKEKKMPKCNTEDLEMSSYDENSDEKNSDEENYSKKKILLNKIVLKNKLSIMIMSSR